MNVSTTATEQATSKSQWCKTVSIYFSLTSSWVGSSGSAPHVSSSSWASRPAGTHSFPSSGGGMQAPLQGTFRAPVCITSANFQSHGDALLCFWLRLWALQKKRTETDLCMSAQQWSTVHSDGFWGIESTKKGGRKKRGREEGGKESGGGGRGEGERTQRVDTCANGLTSLSWNLFTFKMMTHMNTQRAAEWHN